MKRTKISKYLAIGIALMGLVHIAATFSPVIAGKLAPLNESAQQAFMYMSLMCGALLVVCGAVTFMLTDMVRQYGGLHKPYMLILITILIDGILAACMMPHNPCAWIILIMALPLFGLNIRKNQ